MTMLERNAIPTEFVETFTAREIALHVERAVNTRKPLAIVGAPGVGKTETLLHLGELHGFNVITATAANRTLRSFLCDVAAVNGLRAMWKNSHHVYELVRDHLANTVDRPIVIDEAQNLDLDTMRTMLEIQRHAKVGLVFAGNSGVLRRTKVSQNDWAQIDDRITYRLNVPRVHPDDIRAFGVHYNLEGMTAYSYLEQFGTGKSLRKLRGLLDEARAIAGLTGSIKLPHLREAVEMLHSIDEDRGIFKLLPKPRKEENAA